MNPYIWAIITAVVWGAVPIIEKAGLRTLPVWPAMFFRTLGALIGIFLLPLLKFNDIRATIAGGAQGWYYCVLGGFMGAIVGNVCYYHALKTGEVSKIVPIAGSFPLISFILGLLFFSETVTPAKLAGVACIVMGVALLR
ncbi:MAG: EamA family transporter [Candidatus Omnitrophica bacterium]|nr:EamA family transporter [Candidatus Omnitrophota bacterium]